MQTYIEVQKTRFLPLKVNVQFLGVNCYLIQRHDFLPDDWHLDIKVGEKEACGKIAQLASVKAIH